MRMTGKAIRVLFSVLALAALTGCEALLRLPAPTDKPPPALDGFTDDIRYYPLDPAMPLPASVAVDRTLGSISSYAIDTMLKISGVNDLYRLYLGDIAGEFELRYIAIPHTYVASTAEEFNQKEMNLEYALGYKIGAGGIPWQRQPPLYHPQVPQ